MIKHDQIEIHNLQELSWNFTQGLQVGNGVGAQDAGGGETGLQVGDGVGAQVEEGEK